MADSPGSSYISDGSDTLKSEVEMDKISTVKPMVKLEGFLDTLNGFISGTCQRMEGDFSGIPFNAKDHVFEWRYPTGQGLKHHPSCSSINTACVESSEAPEYLHTSPDPEETLSFKPASENADGAGIFTISAKVENKKPTAQTVIPKRAANLSRDDQGRNGRVVVEIPNAKKKRNRGNAVIPRRNNLAEDESIDTVQRQLVNHFFENLGKATFAFLLLQATMVLIKTKDPSLINFFSCLFYYSCLYIGRAVVVLTCGDLFLLKITDFVIRTFSSNWIRLVLLAGTSTLLMSMILMFAVIEHFLRSEWLQTAMKCIITAIQCQN